MKSTKKLNKCKEWLAGSLLPVLAAFTMQMIHAQSWSGCYGPMQAGEASAFMTEQDDSYIVRILLPGRDLSRVSVNLDGKKLHVVAPVEGRFGRFEQDLLLDGASYASPMNVDRREREKSIVVTIPKEESSQQLSQTLPVSRRPFANSIPLSERSISAADLFEQMDGMMNRQMALMHREMAKMASALADPRDPLDSIMGGPSGEMTLKEEKNQYVVQARIPNPRMGSINVGIKNQIITIEAKAEESQDGTQGGYFARYSQYSRSMELPGPVQIARMKVDRRGDLLVITIPKATG